MDKIRVAHVIYGLKFGGAEMLLVAIATKMDREKFDTRVIALTCGGPVEKILREKGIDVRVLGWRGKFHTIAFAKLIRMLREERYDVVHTHLFKADLWGRMAARLAGVPVVVSTIHGSTMNIADLLKEIATARFMDRIIGLYDEARRFIVDRLRVSGDKVVIIPNGVDSLKFMNVRCDVRKKREELGVSADAFVVASIGRLVKMKGQEYFIKAIGEACARNKKIVGIIVGSGEMEAELKKLCADLSIADNCVLVGERRDIPEILSAIDSVVISSVYGEALSMVMIEAMVAGKVVITTNGGATSEIVKHGHNGFIVEPKDYHSIAALLVDLSGNRERVMKVGEAATQTIMQRYTEEKMIASIRTLYEDLLREKKAQAR